jgi:hypothetical protein
MAKETVIIFDGEDKYMSKSNKKYDKNKGVGYFVGGDGEVSTETTSSTTTAAPVNLGSPMPSPDGSADYCSRLKTYIETRGNNLASGDQIMEAHQYFLTHCNVGVPETTTTSSTTTTTTVLPIGTSTTTPTTTQAPTVIIQPTIPIDLGKRPLSSKPNSDGDAKEKSKSNYWLFLVLGLGVAAYLLMKDKNK